MRPFLFLFTFLGASYLWRRFAPRDLVVARSRCAPSNQVAVIRFLQLSIIILGVITSNDTSLYFVALGLFLYVAGQTLIICAARENPYFLPIIVAPPVVIRTGVYRHLRHPGYIGHTVSASGVWLIWQSPPALVPLLLFIALLIWRARKESALIYEWKSVSSFSLRGP